MDNEVRNPNGQNYLTNCSRILKILPLGDSITSGGGIMHLLESRGNRQGNVEYSFAGPPIFVMDEADRQTEARELISSMIEDEDDKLTLSKVCFLVEICVSAAYEHVHLVFQVTYMIISSGNLEDSVAAELAKSYDIDQDGTDRNAPFLI